MKSPNCSASALSLACIEFRGRLTAGGVSGLRSELPSARPIVALVFESIRATAGGNEPQLSLRRSLIGPVSSLGDTGGGMALGV
jgi:hypothetical protein